MALTLSVQSDEVIGIEECLERVRTNVEVSDLDSVIASAPSLVALANHRTFLADWLCAGLKQWERFQVGNRCSSQSFILGPWHGLLLVGQRLDATCGVARVALQAASGDLLYGVAHDHNSRSRTVGYFGSGYETQIDEVEPGSFHAAVGSRVALRFQERTRLGRGKVMLYRASSAVRRAVHLAQPDAGFARDAGRGSALL